MKASLPSSVNSRTSRTLLCFYKISIYIRIHTAVLIAEIVPILLHFTIHVTRQETRSLIINLLKSHIDVRLSG